MKMSLKISSSKSGGFIQKTIIMFYSIKMRIYHERKLEMHSLICWIGIPANTDLINFVNVNIKFSYSAFYSFMVGRWHSF